MQGRIMLDVRDKPVLPAGEGLFKAAGLSEDQVKAMRQKAQENHRNLPEKLVDLMFPNAQAH
jgi:hypothetical protein